MKQLNAAGELWSAHKIIKTTDSITGFDDQGGEVFKVDGIKDFSLFTLAEGQEWDAAVLSVEEEFRELKKRQAEAEAAILSLMDMSLMGGM